jgi:hypothetical protein
MVDMDRCWIVRQRREQHIVHVGDGTADFMFENLPNLELVEVKSSHCLFP